MMMRFELLGLRPDLSHSQTIIVTHRLNYPSFCPLKHSLLEDIRSFGVNSFKIRILKSTKVVLAEFAIVNFSNLAILLLKFAN